MESTSSQAMHPARPVSYQLQGQPSESREVWTRSVTILVSSSRKPVSYINLAKRFLAEHGEVQLSALGIAIAPAVTVAEILKARGLAVDKRIQTALETLADDNRTRQKPKIDIVLTKSLEFDNIVARETERPPRGALEEGGDLQAAFEGLPANLPGQQQ